ncbi:polyribonucleotide nucleotidyltransferase [Thermovibrio ammonificans]|jgi:polyribonucleotide nucleotidyltransferase|uniref:Polyribonucleotide nucleotidyltransferase n=1 Tax=Thermovibrio ammonificans (strain DSM 15698 / JCM 12110 / HB-1) TaxID=648996 RepID=E8T409_THEA1|nr:polyribonucleotide nucleotidyltransferase [Thermovibrio ammonificans]ADU96219.1 polyribonucleotide nucleotidyltransferase [Thermovibrio ammonificans HB-1]
MSISEVAIEVGGRPMRFQTGKVAKQADGSVLVSQGDTIVLVTAVMSDEPREDVDFFPLLVEYRERAYAAGKIPGGFIKREGKPTDEEILKARVTDRSIRPIFPKGFRNDVQVIAFVISADQENDPAVLAINGASAALHISRIPFEKPVGAVRVARVDGKLVINPSYEERQRADIDLIVSGTEDAVVMVEGGAKEVPEEEVLDAILLAHEEIKKIVKAQDELRNLAGKPKYQFVAPELDPATKERIKQWVFERIEPVITIKDKHERREKLRELKELMLIELNIPEEDHHLAKEAFNEAEKEFVRKMVLERGVRIDGRKPDEIRPISIEVGLLPRAHGSALFTRGQTQALVTTTLGTPEEYQLVEGLMPEEQKRFMLHYNFPPFCVGEISPMRGPGRREIGHGALAERALAPVIPPEEEFPYVIRVVSDILESNGSSSMATVCGGSLSLMDAGVPIKAQVAGIAMGLIMEGDKFVVLSDILGDEDHLGDMDFKVAGTRKGVTAIQMDLKVKGISREVLSKALEQARRGRMFILDKMDAVISEPRKELSPYAPRIVTTKIDPEKTRDLIGPSGKTIKTIIDKAGVKITIKEDGTVLVSAPSEEAAAQALKMIEDVTKDLEVGNTYLGKVTRVENYGAFVELAPGKVGLVHISKLPPELRENIFEKIKVSDLIPVKIVEFDQFGRPKLSRIDVTREEEKKLRETGGFYSQPEKEKKDE